MQRITDDQGEHGSHIHGMSASMAELTRRTAMLSAVAYMATRIVAEPAWRDLMPDLLERLGQATKMSRVSLFEAHQDAQGHPSKAVAMIGRNLDLPSSPAIPAITTCHSLRQTAASMTGPSGACGARSSPPI